jgi:RecJ-like exonuclease
MPKLPKRYQDDPNPKPINSLKAAKSRGKVSSGVCVSCRGSGVSSKGYECYPCQGTGKASYKCPHCLEIVVEADRESHDKHLCQHIW